MTSPDTAHTTADRLTTAIAANDADAVDAIYAPDALIWHSTDQIELTLPELKDTLRTIHRVATADVHVKSRHITDEGFIQAQVNRYTLRAGGEATFHAAMFVRLDEAGRVTRIEEYLDGVGLAPLIAAIAGASTDLDQA